MAEPLVGLAMPVYNGERYLADALDSLLAQTYANFEITITDNASDDATETICRDYAARDERVRYHRGERNIGAVRNFRRGFELARGDYFAWVAHDDLRAPRFVEACVRELEADHSAVLCCTGIRIIDADGNHVPASVWPSTPRPLEGTLRDRVRAVALARYWYDFYGLARRSALQRTRLPIPVWGFDVVVLLELVLLGEVAVAPDELILYRVFPEKRQSEVALGLAGPGEPPVYTSWSELTSELLTSIRRADLPLAERLDLVSVFLGNFALRNELVARGIARDGLSSARRAIGRGRVVRAAELAGLAVTAKAVRRRPGILGLAEAVRSRV